MTLKCLPGDRDLKALFGLGGGAKGPYPRSGPRGDGRHDAQRQGLRQCVVELLLLDEQLMGHVVAGVLRKTAFREVRQQSVGLRQAVRQNRSDLSGVFGGEAVGGLIDGGAQSGEARLPFLLLSAGRIARDALKGNVDAIEEVRLLAPAAAEETRDA